MNCDEKRANKGLSVGGYKCLCCGPSPKERPAYRRKIRARLKKITTKTMKREINDMENKDG
jgi:hypothetical protein